MGGLYPALASGDRRNVAKPTHVDVCEEVPGAKIREVESGRSGRIVVHRLALIQCCDTDRVAQPAVFEMDSDMLYEIRQ